MAQVGTAAAAERPPVEPTRRRRGSPYAVPGSLAMTPGLVAYILFSLVPAVGTFLISATNYTGIPGQPIQFVGLSNFENMVSNAAAGFLPSLATTLTFAVSVVVIQNVVALAMAVLLRNRFPLVGLFRALIFLPAALGVTINGILWLLIFSPSQGPAASFLTLFHSSSAFFGSTRLALPLVIFVQVWANIGFTSLVYLASMDNIPGDFYEAARLDGAGRWAMFRQVTWPLISSASTVNILLATVGAMNVYDVIYVLTDGSNNTMTLGMFMFNTSFVGSGDLGLGASVAVMMFVLTLIVALPLQWLLRRREVSL